MKVPAYWKAFVEQHALVRREFEIPEEVDLSELGAEFFLMDEDGIRQEAQEAYPGIGVSKDGFVPVGGCLTGSGDPYFINENDGPGGPLYRIYHDSVSDSGYDRDEAVDVVVQDYREILKYMDD